MIMCGHVDGVKKIIDTREDLSDFLFHFTKGPNGLETLCKILNSGKMIDMNKSGYICFTEAPLSMVEPMLTYFSRQFPLNPKYAPYGIGISKRTFI